MKSEVCGRKKRGRKNCQILLLAGALDGVEPRHGADLASLGGASVPASIGESQRYIFGTQRGELRESSWSTFQRRAAMRNETFSRQRSHEIFDNKGITVLKKRSEHR